MCVCVCLGGGVQLRKDLSGAEQVMASVRKGGGIVSEGGEGEWE